MAIPFRLPTQQETDDNYQILDQLIDQLYHIVRQIILRRGRLVEEAPVPPASTNRAPAQRRGAAAEPAAPSVNMQLNQDLDLSLPLPDIVLSTGFVPESGPSGSRAPVPPPRRFAPATERPQPPPRRPRRRRPVDKRKREDTPEDTRPDQRQRENWLQVGKELRKIADGFRASNSSLQVGRRRQQEQHRH